MHSARCVSVVQAVSERAASTNKSPLEGARSDAFAASSCEPATHLMPVCRAMTMGTTRQSVSHTHNWPRSKRSFSRPR